MHPSFIVLTCPAHGPFQINSTEINRAYRLLNGTTCVIANHYLRLAVDELPHEIGSMVINAGASTKFAQWWKGYDDHLNSPEWEAIQQREMDRTDSTCEDCGEPGRDVHHLHYRNLGREQPGDLVVLCRECHERRHGR